MQDTDLGIGRELAKAALWLCLAVGIPGLGIVAGLDYVKNHYRIVRTDVVMLASH